VTLYIAAFGWFCLGVALGERALKKLAAHRTVRELRP